MDLDLALIWFLAIAILWTGYFVLEGFDFGVGMLLPVIGKDNTDRRVMINSIGPIWDGNEVWVITAVGATLAAFPAWYASMLSGFYLPMLIILLALIVRGVAFEYRGKGDTDRWRARWDAAIIFGSTAPALLWGLIFANLIRGLPMDADHVVSAGLLDMLNPYALLGAATTMSLFVLHGAVFLTLKTDGEVRVRSRALLIRVACVAIPVTLAFLTWTQLAYGKPWTWPVAVVAGTALVIGVILGARGREGWSFTATAATIIALSVVIFGAMFPTVLPSTTDPAYSLTIANASSAPYTLTVMSWVAVVFLPLVLAYQAWSYWVFRKRVTREHIEPVPAYGGSGSGDADGPAASPGTG
ncbi:cytochrome d ubiquinol oxidase subunit II [Nocardiopsis mwathae]|uniref:Cytochrome d ubiquinol oxidase subunit II n=1 Tax=Nocardiopsis mwathae TaxID=1472723 RepID=A0A7W9YJ83_9ACTN|nr:cytochrome d ubiquinol oxidase subunit II [Nocardiopsis mwathae]MBB6173084.1 cytochrome d ubiquinol oxidase subunit II [Nocardiopsis mwathae]